MNRRCTTIVLTGLAALAAIPVASAAPTKHPGHFQRLAARAATVPGRGEVQTLTVINDAHVPKATLRRVENAVERQVKVAGRWWKLPTIRFGPGGWKATLNPGALSACDPGSGGCHSATPGEDGRPIPWAAVSTKESITGDPWATTFDHEILEMLTNPGTSLFGSGRVEVCDMTEGWNYLSGGVWLSDFALPEAYAPDSHGRVDFMGAVGAKEMGSELAYAGLALPIAIAEQA